jgi:hypothetical protein
LADNYADLWAYDLTSQTSVHNNKESIFEAGKDYVAPQCTAYYDRY